MSAFPLHGDPKLLISATRAIKNAKYLQERAGILLPGGVVPNFLREVPMEILRILHLDANSRDLIDSTIASILKQITFPELTWTPYLAVPSISFRSHSPSVIRITRRCQSAPAI